MRLLHRPSLDRGHFDHGWLNTWHTFSFGDYFDPQWNQYRTLRVMNEDTVAADTGFGMHGHRDMEILTWVLSGELEHRDSLGHGERLRPGEMQWMSAGSGIRHSEFNPSSTEATHLYQVWLLPDRTGYEPAYAQRAFPVDGRKNRLQVLAAPDEREGAFPIRQDAVVSVAELDPGRTLQLELNPGRHAWVQMLRGTATFPGGELAAGDGLGVSAATALELTAKSAAELLLFDMA